MNFEFTENGWEEFQYWIETDSSIAQKIKDLLNEIKTSPFQGTGKREPLKYDLKGYWSRRFTGGHRLVYKVEGKKVWIKNAILFNAFFITIKPASMLLFYRYFFSNPLTQ